jgi:DNA-directed RNA polymerase subunit RPC12/RpoP
MLGEELAAATLRIHARLHMARRPRLPGIPTLGLIRTLCYGHEVAKSPTTGATFEVVCPHCKKPFAAELLAGTAERYMGFKCPHCRLFVPYERVDEGPVAAES